MGGDRPNCAGLMEMRFPPRLLRRGAEPFPMYDDGPAEAMVVIFGAPEYAQARGLAQVWEAVGTFKTSPILQAPAYTAHAR